MRGGWGYNGTPVGSAPGSQGASQGDSSGSRQAWRNQGTNGWNSNNGWNSKSWNSSSASASTASSNHKSKNEEGLMEARRAAVLCGRAKAHLIAYRRALAPAPLEAITQALSKRKGHLDWSLLEGVVEDSIRRDISAVMEHDVWDSVRCGKDWLKDWLNEEHFAEWEAQAELLAERSLRCTLCSRDFHDEWALDSHVHSKDHVKKLRNWIWRYGTEPGQDPRLAAESSASAGTAAAAAIATGTSAPSSSGPPPPPTRPPPSIHDDEVSASTVCGHAPTAGGYKTKAKTSKNPTAAQVLAAALEAAKSPASIAKKGLLAYRNGLSQDERRSVTDKIGRRVNDINGIEDLCHVFQDELRQELMSWLRQVEDDDWIYKEPTFSWLSGFYWHPESTCLPQRGRQAHSEMHCHLCVVDCYSQDGFDVHKNGRRHAETMQRWVEVNGATEVIEACACCPSAWRLEDHVQEPGLPIDLEVRRGAAKCPQANAEGSEVEAETVPPRGFKEDLGTQSSSDSVCNGNGYSNKLPGRPVATPYVAFVIQPSLPESNGHGHARGNGWKNHPSSWFSKVRITSRKLRIGPKEGKVKCWGIDLDEPLQPNGPWRSFAVPLDFSGVREGTELHFEVVVYWAASGAGQEAVSEQVTSWLSVKVPAAGMVAVVSAEVLVQFTNGAKGLNGGAKHNNWPKLQLVSDGASCQAIQSVPVMEFAGSGQVASYGGIEALRGKQRPFQLATEDIMLSFFMHIPADEAPAPLLVFFHGDLTREVAQCPRPGLADFSDTYGPALLCKTPSKKGHTARKFVVVTPSCPAEYWWFRYPAEHDAPAYVSTVEHWFRRLTTWVADELRICHKVNAAIGHGMRLSGQSMGGYAALELARAMPDLVSAVGVGAPCFDGGRLNWLAQRLRNVPLWILIGRQDTMCAYEECASLVLKMRDCNSLLARISSVGIKGHNEACIQLDKEWLYQWFLRPLDRSAPAIEPTESGEPCRTSGEQENEDVA